MQLIQLNLNHCRAAHDLLMQTVRDLDADVAVLSEPYKDASTHGWAMDRTGKAALWMCGREPAHMSDVRSADGFVRGRVGGVWVYSCYLAPSLTLEAFSSIIDELSDDIRGRSNTLVGGDFNAWAQDWGSPSTNARGRIILEAFASLDIALLNEGTQHTFNRAGAGSVIDLTYASSALACLARWRISEIYTASDHEAILVSLGENSPSRTIPPNANKAFRQDTLNAQVFTSALAGLATDETDSANDAALKLAVAVERACKASMQQRKTFRKHHSPVYWWNDDIATLRSSCLRARRLVQRARGSPNLLARSEEYKTARSALKNAIRTSKRECFLKLCDDVEKDPWGGAYKKVVKRVNAGSRIGFADDVALVVVAKELAEAESMANSAIRAVESWLAVAGLELASHKTEAVLISSRKRVETAEIRVGGLPITSQRAIRYLGV
ncbi:uncharacterized protein [Drosophila kikkawai]|uniref:Endonuclease/exonuclease/phosphatase domain-containing protein n=1 Tax=Drosophila kikkawai TaxID=30033 RepID=A0ABM4GHU7_DROKI